MPKSSWSVQVNDKEVSSDTVENENLNDLLNGLLTLLAILTLFIWVPIDAVLQLSGRNGFFRRFNLSDPEDNLIIFNRQSFALRQDEY